MLSYNFKHIDRSQPLFEENGLHLWIWNADKIPPHIGLSKGKTYFSLTYKGVEELQTSSMLRKAKRLQSPILFISLEKQFSEDEIKKVFLSFDRAIPGGATCLSPIKKLFSTSDDVVQLAAFLSLMEQKKLIQNVYGMFLKDDYTALPTYSWADIVEQIEILHATK